MKKITNVTKPNMPVVPLHRSFRRFISKVFASFLKRQDNDHQNGFEKEIIEKLREIEDLIEIVAREMARHAKSGKSC